MQIIDLRKLDDGSSPAGLLARPALDTRLLEQAVAGILEDVRKKGDEAVRAFSWQFDKVSPDPMQVSPAEIAEAGDVLGKELKDAIREAKANIEAFHRVQRQEMQTIETMEGVRCWRKQVPIERVGLYIPGGTAPLFSTILMLGIPARIAGCREIVLCSPPDRQGALHPAILFAAQLVGVTQIFKVGGVQAIGAMAYGTATIPKVYKLFGPGNQYVTCAKQLIQREGVAIDMPAGPSEVAVFADETAQPAFVASDLLSQAEHGVDSQVMLVSTSRDLVDRVLTEIGRQLEDLPRAGMARGALENSRAILVRDAMQAMDVLNAYAPEHLILACGNPEELAEQVLNAGSVFLGHFSPESVGDYASGTNHVLPTNGHARAYSGVSLESFVKKITFQHLTPEGLTRIGMAVQKMAEAEGLEAHARAVGLRLRKMNVE
jgi:histidinol dehydrogenase